MIFSRYSLFSKSAILGIALFFSIWFASQQSLLLSGERFSAPLSLLLATGIRIFCVVLVCFSLCRLFERQLSSSRFILPLCFLPLLFCWLGLGLAHAMQLSMLLIAAWLGRVWFRAPAVFADSRGAMHGVAFVLIVLVHVWANGLETPLLWQYGQLSSPHEYGPEYWLISPLYRASIWIKQFSLSNLSYGYWAMAPSVPVHFSSPLFQFLLLFFDVPSINPQGSYALFHALLFALGVAGGFGYYLFLRIGLQFGWWLALTGGVLFYFIAGGALLEILLQDYFAFLGVYTALPFVLLCLAQMLRLRSFAWAVAMGVMLALPFFLLTPHPDFLIYFLIVSSLVSFVMLLIPMRREDIRIKMRLFVVAAIVFFSVGAIEIVPLLILKMSSELSVIGHTDSLSSLPPSIVYSLRWDSQNDWYVLVLAVSAVLMLFLRMLKPVPLLPWFIGFFLVAVLCIPYLSLPFGWFAEFFHVPLNFARAFRRYLFAIFAILTLALIVFEMWVRYVRSFLPSTPSMALKITAVTSLCFLVGSLLCVVRIPTNLSVRDTDECVKIRKDQADEALYSRCEAAPYYLTQKANLANYPLLSGDAANLAFLKKRLLLFEDRASAAQAAEYLEPYIRRLQHVSVRSARALFTASEIIAFAQDTSDVVDAFFLDERYGAVYLYNFSRWDLERRLVMFNLPLVYGWFDTPFFRILSMTEPKSLEKDAWQGMHLRDSHLGVGPGLFVHNDNGGFDTRFLIGPPLLQAFYLFPDHRVSLPGNYNAVVNWGGPPDPLWDPFMRKLLDVSGMDVITVPRNELEARGVPEGVEHIENPTIQTRDVFPYFSVLRNTRSYGMAYVAHNVSLLSQALVSPMELQVKKYLVNGEDFPAYAKAMAQLHGVIERLHAFRDVVVERDVSSEDAALPIIGKGDVSIRAVLGEATRMDVSCERAPCTLVYNLAYLSDWKAYVGKRRVPIERVNFAFMGVQVPEGEHRVWFVYFSWAHVLASVWSMIALIFVLNYSSFWRRWLIFER